jgi:hypothetical protein
MDEHLATKPPLSDGEVVVDVDAVVRRELRGEAVAKDVERTALDALAVCSREVEGPGQVVQVRAAGLGPDVQPCQVLAVVPVGSSGVMAGDGGP